MDKSKKYLAVCVIIAAGLVAIAGVSGVKAWRAAAAREAQMAYLRSLQWELPLQQSGPVTTFADQLFHYYIGSADPAERAKAYGSFTGTWELTGKDVCDMYVGDRQELVFTKTGTDGTDTYLGGDGELLFRQLSADEPVMGLSDTYALLYDSADGTYRLVDLEGQTLYEGDSDANEGERDEDEDEMENVGWAIDNRYAAVAKDLVYDVKAGEVKRLTGSYDEIRVCGGGFPYIAVSRADSRTVFLNEGLEPVEELDFGEDTFDWDCHINEGLIYGVKSGDGKENAAERGYFDLSGQLAAAAPNAEQASDFSEGKGIVYASGGRVYCVDRSGRILFEKQLSGVPAGERDKLSWKSAFRGGRAVIFDGEKCGAVDPSGNWLVKPVFDQLYLGDGDEAVVIYGEKFGVIRFEKEAEL